jgi:hypothetical protein
MVRQFASILGIAMLYPVLVSYAVNAYQPFPKFEYTVHASVRIAPTTPEGWKVWEEENRALEKKQQEELDTIDKATQPFYRALIFIGTPLGLAAIFIGLHLKSRIVGVGLILGGIVSITNAYSGYWDHLDDRIRYVSLLLGFCLLVFLAYRLFHMVRNNPI